MPVCRWLPFAVTDGAWNMAADEVLLESAAAGVASLRVYGWSPPTLSLGYFQSEQVCRSDPLLAGLAYVRRPSGGATLVHHHEVTYALALPPGPPWQTKQPWLQRMHEIVAAALADVGITAKPQPNADPGHFNGVLCFQHVTPGDLLIDHAKVVGSAQRRMRGALLQHGGILLAASPYTPVLPGIRELSGRELSSEDLCTAVKDAFVRATGWELIPGIWTVGEQRRKEELVATKYTTDTWNRKR
jgi:lipoate-protein ligase A